MEKDLNFGGNVLKTFAISGVVFIHSSGCIKGNTVFTDIIFDISRLSVPIFIVVWAYFTESSLLKNIQSVRYLEFCGSKLKRILVPYVFWTLFYFLVSLKLSIQNLDTKTFIRCWLGYGWAGQYYFLILIQLIVFFFALRFIYGNLILLVISLVLSVLLYSIIGYSLFEIPAIPYSAYRLSFFFWVFCALCGIGLARLEPRPMPISLTLWALLVPAERLLLPNPAVPGAEYVRPILHFSSVVLSSILLRSTSFTHRWPAPILSFFNFIGSNTMSVFVLNPFIVSAIKNIIGENAFFTSSNPFIVSGSALAITIAIVTICLIASKVIRFCGLKIIIV